MGFLPSVVKLEKRNFSHWGEKQMKKKKDWKTKKKKRAIRKRDHEIVDLMRIIHHFFAALSGWLDEMDDPRNQSYILYTQSDLIWMGLMKNMCAVKTMHDMEDRFNKETCIETLKILSGDKTLDEMPHSDTLNYYLSKLSPKCLADIRKRMVKSLIRCKSFYRAKLLGKYWRVIVDGTGLFCFKERHCGNCLVTTVKNAEGKEEKRYCHKVLEAKIILGENLVISLDTEFIENENENVTKQDCELNAARRMLERLKREYPRLPICIQGDALYAVNTIMRLCRKNHWEYILTQKETRQKLLSESYEWIAGGGGKTEVKNIGKELGTGGYINHVEETAGKKELANIYEYQYERKGTEGKVESQRFQWITSIRLGKRNLEEMVYAGRGRWKIENEGFNKQKNGIYDIEHLNSYNRTAMKNHYLLTQIADIIMQLYLAWSPSVRETGQSIKNTSSRLLESFRRQPITDEDVSYIKRHTSVYLE